MGKEASYPETVRSSALACLVAVLVTFEFVAFSLVLLSDRWSLSEFLGFRVY